MRAFVRVFDAQYVRDDVHPVVGDSLRKPIDALQYYLVLVVVTLALYHVISLFTLLYKLARKNGVSPWYGYVLGGTFYMAFIMLGAGFFVGGFHPNLKAIHDSRVGLNQDGIYGKTHSDRSKALEGLSFTSASLFFAVFRHAAATDATGGVADGVVGVDCEEFSVFQRRE